MHTLITRHIFDTSIQTKTRKVMKTTNKAFILLTEEQATVIQRELTARLTIAGNGFFCKRTTETGYEMYNPNTDEVVFKYIYEGRSEYNPRVINVKKYM